MNLNEWYELDIPEIEFIKTGAQNFDDIVGGIIKGGITVVAGGSGQGKSLIGLHLASLLSATNKIHYISIENALQIDLKRFSDLSSKRIYSMNMYNIDYENANMIDDSYSALFKSIVATMNDYDVIVIDGLDLMIDVAEDGADMYKNGNILMKNLHNALKDNPFVSIIITWQMNRNSNVKKIDELNQYAIGTSMGIVRYASHVYGVARIDKQWFLKLMKSRTEFNIDKQYINILDYDNNVNLNINAKNECDNVVNDLQKQINML